MPPFGTKLQKDEKRGETVEWKEQPGLAATMIRRGRRTSEIRDAYGYVQTVPTRELQPFQPQQ